MSTKVLKQNKVQILDFVKKHVTSEEKSIVEFCILNNLSQDAFFLSVYLYTYYKYLGDLEFIDEEVSISEFIDNIVSSENLYNDVKIIDEKYFCDALLNVCKSFLVQKCLKDVEFISDAELQELELLNDTDIGEDIVDTVVDRFREKVKEYPDNLCFVDADRKYTYKEIDILTDNIAYALLKKGIKKNDVISIFIDNNAYKFISLIGILKVGAAYVPLGSIYPDERNIYVIENSEAKLVITDKTLKERVSKYNSELLLIEELLRDSETIAGVVLDNSPSINDLFAIIYTSGSTGNPKGVMLSHNNIANFVEEYNKYHKLNLNTRFAAYNVFTFVVHIEEYFTTLCVGGTIYCVPDEIRKDVKALNDFYDENRITNAHLPSQIANLYIKNMHPKTLERLVIGGEAVKPCDPPKEYQIFNSYGPTECTIKVANFLIDARYENTPIGKAIDNVKIYIADKYMRRMPIMFPGEIFVAGPFVALGYKNLVVANSFIKNPYTNAPKYMNMYNTGDIGRYMVDKNLEYLGRRDNQVKIRGYRIELSEIEYALRGYEKIKDAVVVAYDDQDKNKYLVAYVVSDEKISIEDLKSIIRAKKPEYMVPSIILQIDSIPYKAHGKVDRDALKSITYETQNIVKPKTDIEKKLYDFACKVLDNNQFGITTDLFDVGINSIGIMSLMILISDEYNVDLSFNDLYSAKTIERLSLIIKDRKKHIAQSLKGVYPLNRLQKWIVDLCISNPTSTVCNLPHLYKMPKEMDMDRLEKAVKIACDMHPGIKTIITKNKKYGDDYVALRDDDKKINVKRVKLNKLPEYSELVYPYNVLDNELYRISIYECDDANYLFIDIIHAIDDGDSNMLLRNDIERAYLGNELHKEEYTSFDYAVDEEKQIINSEYEEGKSFYKSIYTDYGTEYLPKYDSVERDNERATAFSFESDIDVAHIKNFCKKINVTENSFFLAAFGYLLAKMNNKDSSIFMTIYNGRSSTKHNNVFGLLMKIYTIFARFDKYMPIDAYVKTIQKQNINCIIHDAYAFQDISKDFGIPSDILFLFYGERYPDAKFKFASYDIEEVPVHFLPPAKISFVIKYANDKVAVDTIYYTNLYNCTTIENIAKNLMKVVKSFLISKNLNDIVYI